jgi:hypothetical protein
MKAEKTLVDISRTSTTRMARTIDEICGTEHLGELRRLGKIYHSSNRFSYYAPLVIDDAIYALDNKTEDQDEL